MKHIRLYTIFLLTLIFATDVMAQGSRMNATSREYDYILSVEKSEVEVINNNVIASIQLIAKQDVPAHQSVILVPELQDTISSRYATFPVIYINSRNQQIFFEREISKYEKDAMAVRKYKGRDLQIDYLKSIPYEKWMETSVLKLRKVSCSCNVPTARGEEELCRLRELPTKVQLFPAFRVPKAETKKERKEKGSAYLYFAVNKWDILPDYKNNPAELKKIYQSIDLVKNDPNVKITRMTIEGYASPEGGQVRNQTLSDNRTNALKNYIYQLGLLPNINITAHGLGENWTGLKDYLTKHTDIPQREQMLAIIKENIGQDAKEAKLKNTTPQGFRYCLDYIFPSLRCTNYAVEYTVRPFTVEESEKVFETRPINLSLNEIYMLAEKYKDNQKRYDAIMQKASLLYPNDPYVNLTMSYLAIKRGDADDAEQCLDKVPDWPEKRLNMNIVSYLRGNLSAEDIQKIQNEYLTKPNKITK